MSDLDLEAGVALDMLHDSTPVAAKWQGEDIVLVRHAGRICALADTCTHLGASMATGIVVDGEIRCPFHHARFDLASGDAIGAPALTPLQRFEVVEAEDKVRVVGKAGPVAERLPEPSRSPGRVVIVGGGAAGHACADMLARHGVGTMVTVLSDERDAPYDRTACSKAYLAGKSERDDVKLPEAGLGKGLAPKIRTDVSVSKILPQEEEVETANGEHIAYDVLVLATGAEPVLPDFEGNDRSDVHRIRTLADADALISAVEKASAAIVLGSSYIGLEAAASLIQRGLSVTVISDDSIPLEKTAGPEMGRVLQALHEEKGVAFVLEREIKAWDGRTATLDDGSMVQGDLFVVGMGVKPRTGLARDAGLRMADEDAGGGVAVDRELRTSVENIFAIGDIASVPDPRLGHPIRVEHWVVAQRMGQWLARHLLGIAGDGYSDLPFFWSGHYDTNLRYIGHAAGTRDRQLDGDPDDKDVAITFCEEGEPQALLTCGRDRQSLEVEADWEQA